MKNVKKMAYSAMEKEIIANRCEMRTASTLRQRELIKRNHELMVEMNARWEKTQPAVWGR